ncbi:response regulator transcription factor [Haloferula sp. A504]|uniref:response regulator transcription factor n=1 Tax=Haloferula sp. A504 TaxID=3373601 RepID=UPI0031CBD31A|nr:response regulator [Verrucomicrobiaceae bacterium E54]
MSKASNRIVVVDDDPGIRQALVRLLSAAGLEVTTFECGETLLAAGDAAHSGVLILDIQLPGMNGLEVHDRLQLQGMSIPTIFITGRAGERQLEQIQRLGTPCFSKPFPGAALINAVRKRLPAA